MFVDVSSIMSAIDQVVFLLYGLFSAVLGAAPCVDYSDVCVPAQAMQLGCRCALIRPGQQATAALTLQHLVALHDRSKRDAFEDIRFAILQQPGVDELNQFFSPAESEPVGVDNNVFASINTQVHTSLMTVTRSLVPDVINALADWLSDEARNRLLNCGIPRCEVVGLTTDLMGPSESTRPDRKFAVDRAVRVDIEGEDTTMIAFSTAVSDFVLNKLSKYITAVCNMVADNRIPTFQLELPCCMMVHLVVAMRIVQVLVEWEEEQCKRNWWGKKSCHQETKRREDPRVFDEATQNNWMNYVNREMVGKFRVDNSNLLV